MRLRYVVMPLILSVLIACSYNVILDPNISPSSSIANPIDLKMGLHIPEETKSFRVADRSNLDKYTFHIGQALDSIITKSTRRVFSYVELMEEYPTQNMIAMRGLDIVGIAKITSAKTSLNFDQGFFQRDAEGSTSVSVQLTFYSPEMIQMAAVMASGIGITSEAQGLFSTGKSEYAASVEDSIRNLGDNLIQQIYGNYDLRRSAEHQSAR